MDTTATLPNAVRSIIARGRNAHMTIDAEGLLISIDVDPRFFDLIDVPSVDVTYCRPFKYMDFGGVRIIINADKHATPAIISYAEGESL